MFSQSPDHELSTQCLGETAKCPLSLQFWHFSNPSSGTVWWASSGLQAVFWQPGFRSSVKLFMLHQVSFSVLVFSLFIHFTTQLTDNTSYFKSTWIKMCYSRPFLLWNAVEITPCLLWSSLTFRILEKWRKKCCMKPTETLQVYFPFYLSGLITAAPLSSFNFFFSIIFEANPLLSLLKLILVSSNLFWKYLVLYLLKSPLCFLLRIYLLFSTKQQFTVIFD